MNYGNRVSEFVPVSMSFLALRAFPNLREEVQTPADLPKWLDL